MTRGNFDGFVSVVDCQKRNTEIKSSKLAQSLQRQGFIVAVASFRTFASEQPDATCWVRSSHHLYAFRIPPWLRFVDRVSYLPDYPPTTHNRVGGFVPHIQNRRPSFLAAPLAERVLLRGRHL